MDRTCHESLHRCTRCLRGSVRTPFHQLRTGCTGHVDLRPAAQRSSGRLIWPQQSDSTSGSLQHCMDHRIARTPCMRPLMRWIASRSVFSPSTRVWAALLLAIAPPSRDENNLVGFFCDRMPSPERSIPRHYHEARPSPRARCNVDICGLHAPIWTSLPSSYSTRDAWNPHDRWEKQSPCSQLSQPP
ncbi:hypothetical protein BV20DRAFT_529438 [Pilatotrama ljubarskyi]|nr:hypothetical protein BV20DRAFT_529438 [Pilatotrama ljubarskyi]